MRVLHIIAVGGLLLYSLNLTIPAWWATLVGNDCYMVVMTSVFGKAEQIGDLISSIIVTDVVVTSLVIMFRRKHNG